MKIFLLLLCASAPLRLFSATVTFEWNANTEPDLGGYNFYRFLNGSPAWSGRTTNTTITQVLPNGFTHTVAVTAFTTNGLESDFSSNVIVLALEPPRLSFENRALVSAYYPVELRSTLTNGLNITQPMTGPISLTNFAVGTVFIARANQTGTTNIVSDWSAPLPYNPPATPTGPRIKLESASSVSGPWTNRAELIASATGQEFFRLRIEQ